MRAPIVAPRSGATSATGRPTTSSRAASCARSAAAAASTTCASAATGSRSRGGSCRSRDAASRPSGVWAGCRSCATWPPSSPSKPAAARVVRDDVAARAPLVARLDADDVALPERLARQVAFLDAHPEVGVLGSAAREVNGDGREVRVVRPPEDDGALRRALIRENPMVHSTVTMRRSLVETVGGYDARFAVAQDYDLWMRLAAVTRLANLPDTLVVRRLLPGRVSVARDTDRLRAEARARWRAVRAGAYPAWCLLFALRPMLAAATPAPLRRALRRARG